jgi:hypothetical protein
MKAMKIFALALVALLGASAIALAHAPKIGDHGGPQTNAGPFHLEVVVKDATLDVYLNTHALKPVPTEGYKGVAIFKSQDGAPIRIPLTPAGDNKLSGVAPAPLPAQLEGAVQITPTTGSTVVGKFGGTASQDDAEHHEHDN